MDRSHLSTKNTKAKGARPRGMETLRVETKTAGSDDSSPLQNDGDLDTKPSPSMTTAQHEETEKYVYHDYSTEVDAAPVDRRSLLFRSTTADNEESDMKFPAKLYEILAREKYHHIISWLPHGRSFKIWNTSLLEEEVLPHFFDSANYNSFVRLLNAWKFRRITRSNKHGKSNKEDFNSYYHELFLRGMPHLLARMKRLPKKMRKLPMDKAAEPDFSKYPPLPLHFDSAPQPMTVPQNLQHGFQAHLLNPLTRMSGLLAQSQPQGFMEGRHALGGDMNSLGQLNSLVAQNAASSAAIMQERERARQRSLDGAFLQQYVELQSRQENLRRGLSLDQYQAPLAVSGSLRSQEQMQLLRARLGLNESTLGVASSLPDVLPLPSSLYQANSSSSSTSRWNFERQQMLSQLPRFSGGLPAVAAAARAHSEPERNLLNLYSIDSARSRQMLNSATNQDSSSVMYASRINNSPSGIASPQQPLDRSFRLPPEVQVRQRESNLVQRSQQLTAELVERVRKRRRLEDNKRGDQPKRK